LGRPAGAGDSGEEARAVGGVGCDAYSGTRDYVGRSLAEAEGIGADVGTGVSYAPGVGQWAGENFIAGMRRFNPFVEHDMQFIRMISDLVTVFHEGRILMEDTMDAISADARAREVYLGHRA